MRAKIWNELVEIARQVGIELYDCERTGSGHYKLFLRKNGVERFTIFGGSPGCHRTLYKQQKDMRRVFTEHGRDRR